MHHSGTCSAKRPISGRPIFSKLCVGKLSWFLGLALLLPMASDAAEQHEYTNLQVLPKDVSRDELGRVMVENLRGLGLPRQEGVGCLYCHVGDLDQPRATWDWASDAKPEKQTARLMMRMVQDINSKYLDSLEQRIDAESRVTCATCHAGRTDPRPLETIAFEAYDRGGVEMLVARYRGLRELYYGSNAYDFRPQLLSRLTSAVARDSLQDAIVLAELNEEFNGADPEVRQDAVRLKLEQTIETQSVQAALASLDQQATTLGPEVLTPSLLDSLGWRLQRAQRQEQALAIFQANAARFPGEYLPQESLASILFGRGEREQALALLQAWLEKHPDHERAQRLIDNLQARD